MSTLTKIVFCVQAVLKYKSKYKTLVHCRYTRESEVWWCFNENYISLAPSVRNVKWIKKMKWTNHIYEIGKTKTIWCKSRYVICYFQFRTKKWQTLSSFRVLNMKESRLVIWLCISWTGDLLNAVESREKHVFKLVNRCFQNLVPGFLQNYFVFYRDI